MGTLQFNGDWHFEHFLLGFAGFIKGSSEAYGIIDSDCYGPNSKYRMDGTVLIKFADDFDDSPDPTPAQWKAFELLCEHHLLIGERMVDELRKAMKEWLYHNYYEDYDEDDGIHIDLNDMQDDMLRSLISFESIFINRKEEDGIAFIVIEGSCHYDPEHGVGFRIHGDQVVEFDSAEVAFSDEQMDMKDENNPSLISPHPKYGKLKPCEIINNKQYVDYCIYKGNLSEFEKGLSFTELGQEDMRRQLGLAIQANQPEIVRYLLDRGVRIQGYHPYIGGEKIKYGAEVESLILNAMSEEEKQRYYHIVLTQEILYETQRHHLQKPDSKTEGTSEHLDRIQRIHALSGEKILTQEFINDVVLRYMRSYDLSSENKFERIFYPLLRSQIDEKQWPYHESRADKIKSLQSRLITKIELFIRAYEYTHYTGKIGKIGPRDKWLNELKIELSFMKEYGIVITTDLIDAAREKIKNSSFLSPKEIHYQLLSELMPNPPMMPEYAKAMAYQEQRLHQYMSSLIERYLILVIQEHNTNQVSDQDNSAHYLDLIDSSNKYHGGKYLDRSKIRLVIQRVQEKEPFIPNLFYHEEQLKNLVITSSPEESQKPGWLRKFFDRWNT